MIRALSTLFNFFETPVELQTWGTDRLTEHNLKLSENITLLSTYYGCIEENQRGLYLGALASRYTKPDDMSILITASQKPQNIEPPGFATILKAEHRNDLAVTAMYKKHRKNDGTYYKIDRNNADLFVAYLTLRGPDIIVDTDGYLDSGCGYRGLAYTPRLKTALEGALISIFYYADPLKVKIKNQENLISEATGKQGFAVGISNALGGKSKRIKAISEESIKGSGDDIACAISIY